MFEISHISNSNNVKQLYKNYSNSKTMNMSLNYEQTNLLFLKIGNKIKNICFIFFEFLKCLLRPPISGIYLRTPCNHTVPDWTNPDIIDLSLGRTHLATRALEPGNITP